MKTTLQEFCDSVWEHEAPFYRKHWRNKRRFEDLPRVTRAEFASSPLAERRYKKADVAKIVAGDPAFILERSFADIGVESFGMPSRRPWVQFVDPHEAIEKALWCYQHDSVPLVAEADPEIAISLAERYRPDSLICDEASLTSLLPLLERHALSLEHISLVGPTFRLGIDAFEQYGSRLRLVLALAETGSFATSRYGKELRFEPLPGWTLEHESTLAVTRRTLLVTPLIRYETGIRTQAAPNGSFILL